MARYLPEPPFKHGSENRIGILLVNLGTPHTPTAKGVRPYLKQFLSDPRVVEIPRLIWWPILNGIILNTRPAKSAAKYAKIWTPEGSPLRAHTLRLAKLLAGYYTHAGHPDIQVEYAMRYGDPSIEAGLQSLRERQCKRILLLPLYPQYAASTTGSSIDALTSALTCIRNLPELRWIRSFHDHPAYIGALVNCVQEHWQRNGRGEKLIISFHGVPRFTLDKGDPYHCECHKTARLLAAMLSLKPEQYVVCFQSRFGRAQWLKPYTQPTLEALARQNTRSVDVICPGFVSDCLETLEEIAIECKAAFLKNGGKEFNYIPCLNIRHDWIDALLKISRQPIEDWLADVPNTTQLEQSAQRANAMGASQ